MFAFYWDLGFIHVSNYQLLISHVILRILSNLSLDETAAIHKKPHRHESVRIKIVQ